MAGEWQERRSAHTLLPPSALLPPLLLLVLAFFFAFLSSSDHARFTVQLYRKSGVLDEGDVEKRC